LRQRAAALRTAGDFTMTVRVMIPLHRMMSTEFPVNGDE
jgi:hypothetical protein